MHSELGSRPWVAYVVPFPYPWGQAGSRRVDGVSRSIAATGRDVLVVALPGHEGSDRSPRVVHTDTRSGASVLAASTRPLAANPAVRQWQLHVAGAREALRIVAGASATPPSHVVVYGTVATPLSQVVRWGRRRGVAVVADIVERYSPVQFGAGVLSPGFTAATVGFDLVAPRVDGVIAISRHLESHFAAKGVATVRVPPTSDLSAIPVGDPGDDGFVLGYFGSPGRKDRLAVVVEAFERVRAGRAEGLRMVIGGPGTREALQSRPGLTSGGVELVGAVPQHEVAAVLGSVHATVLARPASRYAQAGYPTKVVESLAVGTPVICNLTSDLGDVVRDGVTGWVSAGPSVDEMAVAIRRAADTSREDLRQMRAAARAVAEDEFDVTRHVAGLDRFLDETGGSAAGGASVG